jgi:hypothetical protein
MWMLVGAHPAEFDALHCSWGRGSPLWWLRLLLLLLLLLLEWW